MTVLLDILFWFVMLVTVIVAIGWFGQAVFGRRSPRKRRGKRR